MKLFFCKVEWYSSYNATDNEDLCFIFAKDYDDACAQLNQHFNDIFKISIESVCDDTAGTTILFVENDEDLVQSIKNSNCY